MTHFIVKYLILTFFQDCTHFLCSLLIINWIILWNKNNAPKALLTYIQCTASKVVSSWLFFRSKCVSCQVSTLCQASFLTNRWRWRHTSVHKVDFNFTLGHTPASLFKSWLDLAALHEGFLKPKMIFVCFQLRLISFHLLKFGLAEAELSKYFLLFSAIPKNGDLLLKGLDKGWRF